MLVLFVLKTVTPLQVSNILHLQIWRKNNLISKLFKLVGIQHHKVTTVGFQNIKVDTSMIVNKNDYLGFYFPGQSIIPFEGNECTKSRTLYVSKPSKKSALQVGAQFTFKEKEKGWNPCRTYAQVAIIKTGVSCLKPFALANIF